MGAINVITLQGYYYLYALYFDYPLNNAFFANEENQERVRESLRTVQRLRAMVQPYRKSWARSMPTRPPIWPTYPPTRPGFGAFASHRTRSIPTPPSRKPTRRSLRS